MIHYNKLLSHNCYIKKLIFCKESQTTLNKNEYELITKDNANAT